MRLDPSYTVWFDNGPVEIPADLGELKATFDAIEPGAGGALQDFLDEAQVKYEIGMNGFVQKPAHSIMEFATWETLKQSTKLTLLRSFSEHARKYFSDERLLQIIEFPVLFLGAKPEKTPALYASELRRHRARYVVSHGRHARNRARLGPGGRRGRAVPLQLRRQQITDDGQRVTGVELQDGTH